MISRETLIVIGVFVLSLALRSSRKNILRKLGAFCLIAATFALFYYSTGSILIGTLGACLWLCLPWFEILTNVRHQRIPVNNRLYNQQTPNPSFFPNAIKATNGMEEAGFEYVTDCGWKWAGMQQHFRLYWNPEERAFASVCLCEQETVAFAFISITSTDSKNKKWRTTNYPFSPALRCCPKLKWNHVPCEKSCFHQILRDHRRFLSRKKVDPNDLQIPDPDLLENIIESEMRQQIDYNLKSGIIIRSKEGHYKYSKRGLIFMWIQLIKDMVRLC